MPLLQSIEQLSSLYLERFYEIIERFYALFGKRWESRL